jgi:hypothetical protein
LESRWRSLQEIDGSIPARMSWKNSDVMADKMLFYKNKFNQQYNLEANEVSCGAIQSDVALLGRLPF